MKSLKEIRQMGFWRQKKDVWYEIKVVNCQLCGQMIPKNMWISEIEAREIVFCSPECENMYREYWLPRYRNLGETNGHNVREAPNE